MSRPLIWLTAAPYAGSRARAGVDLALSFAAFAQAPTLLFSGDAVLALVPRWPGAEAEFPSLRKIIDSLPLYDVETLWVDAASVEAHGLATADLPPFAHLADTGKVRALLDAAGHVLSV